MIGMIGGHVDVTRPLPGVLEATARREVAEEVGLDLSEVTLRYLESEFFITDGGERQITVTFTAKAPPGVEPYVNAPDELVEVGWWTLNDLEADPRCPPWLPALIRRASLALADGHQSQSRTLRRTVSGMLSSLSITSAVKGRQRR